MRVAIINSVYGQGSTGKIVREIENTLIANGHECKCYYGRKSGNENGGEFFGSKFSVLSHALFSRFFGKQGLRSSRATKKLVKELKAYKPDVVNLHNIHGYYLNYKILFNYLIDENIPVVWTLHDLWPITGHCAYFDGDNCNIVNDCKNCSKIKEYPSAMFDNTAKNFKIKKQLFSSVKNLTLVCPSVWVKNQMENSFLRSANFKVINNGINLDLFKNKESDFRKKYNLQDKKILLGVSLQWTHRKGIAEFNKLAEELPCDYKIVLVGEGSETVNPKILAIGKTQNLDELCQIYLDSDILVNPTVMDNFPTVNIEALACGLPVITYNTGGSAEIIDSTCGIAVNRGDYNALKQAILEFDCEKFTRENCRLRAKSFDSKDKFKEYIDLFSEVKKC